MMSNVIHLPVPLAAFSSVTTHISHNVGSADALYNVPILSHFTQAGNITVGSS